MSDPVDQPGRGRRLVLVRHGRTAWNAEGRAQGHTDVSLDEVGRAQAEEMAPVVAAYAPTLLLTSDLARARQTAEPLERLTGLTARTDARLREYDTGGRTGMTAREYLATLPPEEAARWDAHTHVDAEGAETVEDVAARLVPALGDVLEELGEGRTAVLVLHGAALRVGVAGLLGWPLRSADSLAAMANCGWAVLEERGRHRLRLSAYGLGAGGGTPDSRP